MNIFKWKMFNSDGFSMMDGLMALFLNSLTIMTLTFLIQQFYPLQNHFSQSDSLSEHWFVVYLERTLEDSNIDRISPQRIVFTQKHQKNYIEFYSNRDGIMIRRRTEKGGHEVLLNHFEAGSFHIERSLLILELKTNGKTRKYRIPIKKRVTKNELFEKNQ